MKHIFLISLLLFGSSVFAVDSNSTTYDAKVAHHAPAAPKQRDVLCTLEGTAIQGEGIEETLAKFVSLGLFDPNDKKVGDAMTDEQGHFLIKALLAGGDYKIKPLSNKYTGSLALTVQSYETKDLQIKLSLKK